MLRRQNSVHCVEQCSFIYKSECVLQRFDMYFHDLFSALGYLALFPAVGVKRTARCDTLSSVPVAQI